jgi:uncharacterized protein (TIGR03643 family)
MDTASTHMPDNLPDNLSAEDRSRIIEMAWEDRTTFEAIFLQYGLREKDVIALMRSEMKRSSFEMWRKRVTGRTTKHKHLREPGLYRFKSQNQK